MSQDEEHQLGRILKAELDVTLRRELQQGEERLMGRIERLFAGEQREREKLEKRIDLLVGDIRKLENESNEFRGSRRTANWLLGVSISLAGIALGIAGLVFSHTP